jgi:hypothetical protein
LTLELDMGMMPTVRSKSATTGVKAGHEPGTEELEVSGLRSAAIFYAASHAGDSPPRRHGD